MRVKTLAAARYALRSDDLRRRWDAYLLRLPLIGKHLRTLDATRFASTLAILVGSGVPLLAALDAGRQVIVRLPLQDAVGWVSDRVREGMPLARALGQSRQFPPLLVHMIASGEAPGQCEEQPLQRPAARHRPTPATIAFNSATCRCKQPQTSSQTRKIPSSTIE